MKRETAEKSAICHLGIFFNQVNTYHYRDGEHSNQGILLLKQFNLYRFQGYGQDWFLFIKLCHLKLSHDHSMIRISNISLFRVIYYT